MSTNENTKQILIVDDHPLFLKGIADILAGEKKLELAGVAEDGAAALKELKAKKPVHLLITDVSMPDMDGIELSRKVKQLYPATKILVLSVHCDRPTLMKLMDCGIDGFLSKNAGSKELLKAVYDLFRGGSFFSDEVKEAFFKTAGPESKKSKTLLQLTQREKEILKLLAKEYTTPEIAEMLFISPLTVETHRKNMLRKLDVRGTVGLVRRAVQSGLIENE